YAVGLTGEREHGPAVDLLWLQADAGVADLRCAHQVVQRHAVGLGQRQEQLEAGPPLTVLEARERARGDAGALGQVTKCHSTLLAEPLEPGPYAIESHRDRAVVGHGAIPGPFPGNGNTGCRNRNADT